MPKPVCIPCQRFFRPEQNGFRLIEGMPTRNGAEPGTAEPDSWKPYKLWMADKWRCHGCGAEIVVGFGARPIAEHYQTDFADQAAGTTYQVNDC